MTDLSITPTVRRGRGVSAGLIEAVAALLDADPVRARELLAATIEASTPAAVAHRLDVVGRNLVPEVGDVDVNSGLAEHAALATVDVRVDPAELYEAWAERASGTADIDLVDGRVDLEGRADRLWAALVTAAWVLDEAGFPPQVIA